MGRCAQYLAGKFRSVTPGGPQGRLRSPTERHAGVRSDCSGVAAQQEVQQLPGTEKFFHSSMYKVIVRIAPLGSQR